MRESVSQVKWPTMRWQYESASVRLDECGSATLTRDRRMHRKSVRHHDGINEDVGNKEQGDRAVRCAVAAS